ncbi:MAG TPA: two-component regulator propeller domain-containing protein, partial [Chitinophagales bacterium]|nr:two-component regulator propeller domain-containing protein [Chitinophagales bacterium]
MKLSRVLGLLACFIFALSAHAQHLYFETLTTRNGLSSNDITCVYEDHNGFLWVGTRDGLNKFDGRVFKSFRADPADSNSLSGNNISAIMQDKQGIFWIATRDGGLTRYDENAPEKKQFRQFRFNPKDPHTIATNQLFCLEDWNDDYVLIGAETSPGIFINKKTFQFSYWNFPDGKLAPQYAVPKYTGKYNWIQWISET